MKRVYPDDTNDKSAINPSSMPVGIQQVLPSDSNQAPEFLRWEYVLATGLAIAIASSVAWNFLFQVKYSATMLEYIQKFLPAFLDNGITAIFDTTNIGDPRPRLVANFLAFVNVKLRGFLFDYIAPHPSLSITWMLYPISLILFYKTVFTMTASTRCAFMSTVLYAASPSLMDILVNYYIPAKPIVNLMFIGTLYGTARVAPHPNSGLMPKPLLGAVIVFWACLCGLLSDETAFFFFACIPLLFFHVFWPPNVLSSATTAITASLTMSGAVFLVLAFYAIPYVNSILGQAPLPFLELITKGVYKSLFGLSTPPPLGQIVNYSPLALLAVIISTHTIPFRVVMDIWTRGSPPEGILHWQWHEQISLFFLICLLLFLLRKSTSRDNFYLTRLMVAFFVFVFMQALVILPLAPWIVEVNYYAGFSSIFFALMAGHLIGSCRETKELRLIAWMILGYFVATQFINFLDTAKRHPSFDKTELSWQLLSDIKHAIDNGKFEEVTKKHPFPSRIFSWAFEYEASHRNKLGEKVDLQPMSNPGKTLYGSINLEMAADPKIVLYEPFIPKNEADVLQSDGVLVSSGSSSAILFKGRIAKGAVGPWNYTRKFDNFNNITERIWYTGLMRLWQDEGKILLKNDKICFSFKKTGEECFSRLYRLDNTFYAFNSVGALVTHFRWGDRL